MIQLFNQEFVFMCGAATAYKGREHTQSLERGTSAWLAIMGLRVRDDQKGKGNKNKRGK